MQPNELKCSALWWKGPVWLFKPKEFWPTTILHLIPENELPEIKNQTHTLFANKKTYSLCQNIHC